MLHFIINPNSGGETGYAVWKKLERRLKKTGALYKVYITDCPGDATRIAREISTDPKEETIIAAVGGDGTMNEVVNGLRFSEKLGVGYIPNGSGNDFARGMKLGKKAAKSLSGVVEHRSVSAVDYGVLTFSDKQTGAVTNRRFLVSCGIGFDAAICESVSASNIKAALSKVKLQKLAYAIIGVREIFRSRPVKGSLLIDGEQEAEFNDIQFISAQIHKTEGGGIRFAPGADHQDGLFTLCIVHTKSKAALLMILVKSLFGKHIGSKGVRTYDCRQLKIRIDEPRALHCDGEVLGMQSELELHCVERKLRMVL